MNTADAPSPQGGENDSQAESADAGGDNASDAQPTYPAYSTPPPEGLKTSEDG